MKKLFPLFVLWIAALACSTSNVTVSAPTMTQDSPAPPQAVFTAIPTFTQSVPTIPPPTPRFSEVLTVQDMTFNDSLESPPFASTIDIPVLQGSNDPRVAAFNELLYRTAQNEADQFKNDVLAYASVPPMTSGSSFDLRYSVIGQRGDVWSIKYDVSFYSDGAAHPGHYSITINYDLANGRQIALAELFLPGSNHLQIISDHCKTDLAARDITFDMFSSGADPLPENYQHWNLSDSGLVITFDEYQVAPYAAGPQTVMIPFSVLQGVINLDGVLSPFVQ